MKKYDIFLFALLMGYITFEKWVVLLKSKKESTYVVGEQSLDSFMI